MKPPQSLRLACIALLSAFTIRSSDLIGQEKGNVFYVSPSGNDQWSGRFADALRDGTDGPFATLERAQQAVRIGMQGGRPRGGGFTVYIRRGVYPLSRTLKFTSEDSGAEGAPNTWSSYSGEEVMLTGAKTLSGFEPVVDTFVCRRIDAHYRDRILQLDLKACGIRDVGEISQRGTPGMELFFNGERMPMARWPNSGWLLIADVPQSGAKLFNEGLARERRFDGVPVGRHYGRIKYDGDRPRGWSGENEVYVHGYWTWDWSDSYQKVAVIDTATREITLQEPHHNYGYTKNQRYYFLNILEELDRPGEWCLDRKRGMLYFWPPLPLGQSRVQVSLLETPLLSLENARYVTIRGLHFTFSRGAGVVVSEGSHNQLAGCTLNNLGGDAVVIDGGTQNGIISCDIHDVALGAIRLKGGDRQTLTPAGNYATNNHIHDYSIWVRTGQYAIFIDGVGNRMDHNLIHDAPFEAVYLRGNDHLIEFNEIHDVTQETGDAGAIHTGRDWTWRGNVIRYNYFHDLHGPGLHGVVAVYLDDWASGFTVYGNVFYRAGRGVLIGGGRDNTVENNVFIRCTPSVHVDARGLGWASYYFEGEHQELRTKMEEVHFDRPPYSTKYPELLSLYQDQPAVPKNNRIIRNVSVGGRWIDLYDYAAYDFSVVTMEDNVIADRLLCRRRQQDQAGWDPYYLDIDRKEGYVTYLNGDSRIMNEFRNNLIMITDPGFIDLTKQDFRLRDDSPAYNVGFTRIPMEEIGIYKDEYRKVVNK